MPLLLTYPVALRFLLAARPQALTAVLAVVQRRGLLIADPVDPYLNLEPRSSRDQIQAASIAYSIAIGPLAGCKALTKCSVPPLDETLDRPLWSGYLLAG